MTRVILFLFILNFAMVFIAGFVTLATNDITYVVYLDRFCEWDSEGVLNQDRLAEVIGSERASNWRGAARYLAGHWPGAILKTGFTWVAVFGFNALVLGLTLQHLRQNAKQRSLREQSELD